MMAGSFRGCDYAHGPWAGAIIAVLGGLRAEEVVAVTATLSKDVLERALERFLEAAKEVSNGGEPPSQA